MVSARLPCVSGGEAGKGVVVSMRDVVVVAAFFVMVVVDVVRHRRCCIATAGGARTKRRAGPIGVFIFAEYQMCVVALAAD